jgi:type I restriction enzyme S subunit
MSEPRLVRIEEFCRTGSGTTPSRQKAERYYGGAIPWVKSGELRESEIFQTEENVTEAALQETPLKLAPKGALLVAMYGATVGRVGILGVEATTNQAVCHIVPDPNRADVRYMFHALQFIAPYFVSRGSGGAQPNISQEKIKEAKVFLPDIEGQRRIAAILDQADVLRRARCRSIDRLSELGQSIFYEMFGDPLTNSMGWSEERRLGEVSEIVSGITKGRTLNDQATRVVPYLAVVNVQDRALCLDPLKTIEATHDEIERYRLQRNDLLLTEGGDPDKLGRGTLWNDELPECIHQNHVFRVRLHGPEIEPLFLNWLIGSERGKRYFLRSAKQTTGIASINMTQLRSFPLILPPLDLQRAFVSRMSEVTSFAAVLQTSATAVDELFASLQQRAFRGEL